MPRMSTGAGVARRKEKDRAGRSFTARSESFLYFEKLYHGDGAEGKREGVVIKRLRDLSICDAARHS